MKVHCDFDCCIYCENLMCKKEEIYICDGECGDLLAYYDAPEYQKEYWIAVKGKDDMDYRRLKRGKSILINGAEFFTEDDTRYDCDDIRVTDAKSGRITTKRWVKDHWGEYLAKLNEIPIVMSLPVEESK